MSEEGRLLNREEEVEQSEWEANFQHEEEYRD